MSKPKHPRLLAETEAQAIVQQPARQPAQAEPGGRADPQPAGQPGGRDADLQQAAHRPGGEKALESAIANAENNHQLDVDRLVVTRAEVGRSVVMRRFHARGRGRSARVEKWFSHLKIVVAEREQTRPGRRPHSRWVTRSIRSGCGSASTAPGTAAGSPARDYAKLLHEDLKLRTPSAQQAARRRRLARGDRASGEEAARDDLCGAARAW